MDENRNYQRKSKILDAYDKILQTITYDELDRATKTTNALGYENSVLYNENFEIITKTNALGKNTNYEYNKIGKLVKSIDAEGGVISFTYDEIGNMKTFTDQNGGVTILDYDLAGRLIKETMSTGGVKTYTYNSLNQLTQTINARGQNLDFSYDKNGRLTDYASNKYTYDKNGNVLTVTNEEGTTKRQYDQLNRVTSYEDVFGNIIRYEYDEVGNIIKLKYPTGETVSYSYDLANNLLTVTDYRNRVTSYEYNKNDILIETKLPDGTIEKLSYNELNQMVEKKIIYKTQEKIYKFTYDKVGNIIEEDKPNLSDENAENVLNIIERTMTYTKGNRLETFNGETIIYDADGNMTTGPLKGTMAEYHYDKFDQLLSVSGTNYKYDGSGTRLKQSWSNDTKALSYITDPNSSLSKVLITTETPTNKTKIYVYGLGLISQEDVGESYTNYRIFHYDYRGSTIALTDETGAIKDSFVYGPYGELVQNTGKIETIFLYVGKYGVETDQNSLIYMRARYYNVDINRFLNIDPVRDGLNWFLYVDGNPVSSIDPSGTMTNVILNYIESLDLSNKYSKHLNNKSNSKKEQYILFQPMFYSGFMEEFLKRATDTAKIINGLSDPRFIFESAKNIFDGFKNISTLLINKEITINELLGLIASQVADSVYGDIKYIFENYSYFDPSTSVTPEQARIFGRKMFGASLQLARIGITINSLYGMAKNYVDSKMNSVCFTEETIIITIEGNKKISDIKEGDYVLSENEKTKEKSFKKVVRTFLKETEKLIHVFISEEEIKTTETHLFWVEGKGFTEAYLLKIGDIIKLKDGSFDRVKDIYLEILDQPIKVYNFEVLDWHTYFVSNIGVLVHNDCFEGSGSNLPSAKNLYGSDFEDYLTKNIGGEGSFSKGGRDFDGGVGNQWWEAKSGSFWENRVNDPKAIAKFKSDMGDRLRIATENGATYELFSNSPIPQVFKDYLIKKGIPFTEILH